MIEDVLVNEFNCIRVYVCVCVCVCACACVHVYVHECTGVPVHALGINAFAKTTCVRVCVCLCISVLSVCARALDADVSITCLSVWRKLFPCDSERFQVSSSLSEVSLQGLRRGTFGIRRGIVDRY